MLHCMSVRLLVLATFLDVICYLPSVVNHINFALYHQSCIDYMLTFKLDDILQFEILDPDTNFSDHLPIAVSIVCSVYSRNKKSDTSAGNVFESVLFTLGQGRYQLILFLHRSISSTCNAAIGVCTYESWFDIFRQNRYTVLTTDAELYVLTRQKNYYKFWWNEELNVLKTLLSSLIRFGRPRVNPIFNKRQMCRAHYRKGLRDGQKRSTTSYTNDLHEALLAKDGPNFWKCWRSKFETRSNCTQVNGCVEPEVIANNFARYFSETCC